MCEPLIRLPNARLADQVRSQARVLSQLKLHPAPGEYSLRTAPAQPVGKSEQSQALTGSAVPTPPPSPLHSRKEPTAMNKMQDSRARPPPVLTKETPETSRTPWTFSPENEETGSPNTPSWAHRLYLRSFLFGRDSNSGGLLSRRKSRMPQGGRLALFGSGSDAGSTSSRTVEARGE